MPAEPSLAHPKILTLPGLLSALAEAGKKRVVFTNGCFDLLHPGHVDLLARCRAQGDLLVLGLNSDASVSRQGKSPPRPIVPFAERAFVLAHLAAVDYIVGFEEDTPLELVLAIRPQVLIKGGDWAVADIAGGAEVEADGGRVLSLPLLGDFSTSGIIFRIEHILK
ncbi:MAG: adenylyltransferase/cytidyltransferase family protein [Deltaproteobacteria bacterium]|jgi:rfaE bifunctional protein nucleotidyltransferase chain/domain|nr:adenylyltransferase/cytidyltransferase family protein [Deltaproteobacteria bacterium]